MVRKSELSFTVLVGLSLGFVCIGSTGFAQSDCPQFFYENHLPLVHTVDHVLCQKNFALGYSDKTLTNSFSAEHLTDEMIEKSKRMRRYGSFDYRNPILRDYKNSGYDRGHMTPSGDMPDYFSQIQTFQYQNIVPQTHALNSGKWNWIEHKTRQMALHYHSLFVVTGPYFTSIKTIGTLGIWVPFATWKAIYIPQLNKAGVYTCFNRKKPVCYIQTLDAFYKRTAIDPFPALEPAIKKAPLFLPKPKPKRPKRVLFPIY
ncbi:hypothetical protein COMNV_00749 [Commensalibacter sp. Nvir]|uniref:DNA/RNA non-specific endonuclease n=1 Tax=Commensalibacter sp. Nvir TaxID=3069817 RepID=UPI002D40BEAB|nr:hypothetical protein COMNV_00749 [Commensalibacter sp. Nvir]